MSGRRGVRGTRWLTSGDFGLSPDFAVVEQWVVLRLLLLSRL